jgi:hypothetical protein
MPLRQLGWCGSVTVFYTAWLGYWKVSLDWPNKCHMGCDLQNNQNIATEKFTLGPIAEFLLSFSVTD